VSKALRVPLEGLAAGAFELRGPVARYVARVHRLGVGASLLLFDPESGMEADARLVEVGRDALRCEVEGLRPSGYRAYPVCLVQGLAKGAKPDLTLRDATALGVESVVFVETERAVVRVPAERAAGRVERWERIAAEAARQSGRGNIPRIVGPLELEQALAEVEAGLRLVLTASGAPLLERLTEWPRARSVALLVGPEGGLGPEEQSLALERGFLPASLGPTTLRTELASVAALGVLVAFASARGIG
jgi:16S rRNA (uracil1498-N3)-methyltransferase